MDHLYKALSHRATYKPELQSIHMVKMSIDKHTSELRAFLKAYTWKIVEILGKLNICRQEH